MKLIIATLAIFGFLGLSHAEETLTEKAQVKVKSAKRTAKKGLHRANEAVCGDLTGDSKLECLSKKTKNRLEEGKDSVKDKGTEVKNAVDSDSK